MNKIYSPTQLCGLKAQNMARAYLQKKGYRLVKENFRTKAGEIDLIMETPNTLVFVEVRFRKSTLYASSCESITYTKRKRIITTASIYQQKNPTCKECRFDVIAINSHSDIDEIDWIPAAFHVE
ncbi:MAG: YraN family protein [Gammaproteobacteria bacterium]|nr:YraN family protein [Gammaproteobacteria bacterium]